MEPGAVQSVGCSWFVRPYLVVQSSGNDVGLALSSRQRESLGSRRPSIVSKHELSEKQAELVQQ